MRAAICSATGGHPRIITRAVPPTSKSSPPRLLIIAGSFVFGLIGGSMIGLLRDQFNPTIVSARELASAFRIRVLAELSDFTDGSSPVFAPGSPQAAAMRRLLGFLRSNRGKGAVTLLTSPPGSADIRPVIALNLAVCAGAEGARVLLAVSDFDEHDIGSSATARDRDDRGRKDFAEGISQTPWRGVEFLRLPAAGFQRHVFERLRDLIAERADAYDLIVIDDGLSSTESVLLGHASFLQNVIMVVESGQTRRDELQEGLDALNQGRATLTGAVLAA